MKKLALTCAALFFMATPSYASHIEGHEGTHNIVTVKVSGLVCDFCARAVEKVFYKQEGVEGVDVDLNDHEVTLFFAETADMPDETITKLITDSGYNVMEISREKQ